MKRKTLTVSIGGLLIFSSLLLAFFKVPVLFDFSSDEFNKGKVVAVVEEGTAEAGGLNQPYQKLKVQILNGKDSGQIIDVDYGGINSIQENQKVKKDDVVVLAKQKESPSSSYQISDKYRLTSLFWLSLLFLSLAILFGRVIGFTSVIGMLFSLLIIIKFVIPQILNGGSPLVISLIGAVFIGTVSIYLAHGFSRRTSIALLSTLITLSIAAALAYLSVILANISGTVAEATWYLQLEGFENLDPKGLFLGGVIIGVLGILDDITTAQVAVIDELHKANSKLSRKELYKRGLSVGQEHIAALVNTLVLAYAGASFPLLILLSIDKTEPWWVTLNDEFLAEEVVRTLVGSIALVLAVPISTFLAAYLLRTSKDK